jgi:hypothetical protein
LYLTEFQRVFGHPHHDAGDGTLAPTEFALQVADYKSVGAYRKKTANNAWSPIMAGLEAAKRRGKRGGRPIAISEETMDGIREALKNGASKAAVCRTFGVKRNTLYDALARETGNASPF